MKNTTIRKRLNIELTQASAAAGVSKCQGLRASTVDGRNVLSVSPRLESAVAGCQRPLAAFYDGNGNEHLLMMTTHPFSGLTILSEDQTTDLPMDAEAICALAVGSGFVVMTSRGPLRVVRDAEGRWSVVEHFTSPAQVRLTAQRVGELVAYTHSMSLPATDFTRLSPSLSEAGVKKLTSGLADAYHALAASAVGSSNWIQPVQARYRLIGESGEIIYTSAPVVMCPDGWQLDDEISVVCSKSSADTLEVPRIALRANAFRINVELSEDSIAGMLLSGVRSIELLASPQIHPFDAGASASARISREATDSPALSVSLPGAKTGFTAQSSIRLQRLGRLEQMIDTAAERVAVIDLASVAGPFQCLRSDSRTPEQEAAIVERICRSGNASSTAPADISAGLLSEIASPHCFTAATVAVSGDTVVWGDITPVPAPTVSIEDFTTDFAPEPYEGMLCIRQADGTRRTMAVSGPAMPRAWAPQVSYPEAGVVGLELYLRSESGGRHGAIPLTTGVEGHRSVWLDRNLSPTPLEEWSGTMPTPDDAPAGRRRPGALVTCLLTQPLLPLAALECSHAPVRAIHPALRSRSSWDFSRARFYALTADAIHAVSVAPQRASISASAMDSRGIAGGRASVYTPLGVMALHRGNLLKISGSGVDTIATAINFSQLAWDDEWQSLWLLNDLGDMRMFDPQTKRWADIASPANFIAVSTVGNRLWLTDCDELYRPETKSQQLSDSMRRIISWRSDVPLPDLTAADAIELKMSATFADLTITLSSHPGPATSPSRDLMKIRVSGPVSAPVALRFPAIRRPFLSLTLDGSCSPDFSLYSITLHTLSKKLFKFMSQ